MKVNIVCYEDIDLWILGKFAKKLDEELTKKSIDTSISKHADPQADINHHIIDEENKLTGVSDENG
jgi:hypothetical protein